jgi:hypothetical protein
VEKTGLSHFSEVFPSLFSVFSRNRQNGTVHRADEKSPCLKEEFEVEGAGAYIMSFLTNMPD